MNLEQSLEDLKARLMFQRGHATLMIFISPTEASVEENRRILVNILLASSLQVVDMGRIEHEFGPSAWVDATNKQSGDVYVMASIPTSVFGASAFSTIVNTEREWLRKLAGPVLLLVSRDTEDMLRKRAPDFLTWAATVYELPESTEFLALARSLGAMPTSSQRHVQNEKPLRFLHLSDFHLKPNRIQRYDQDKVLRGLIEFLESERKRFPLDAIFITGDLAFSGSSAEYALVVEFLQKLLEVTGVAAERMFVVPGNHDVDRRVGKWLLRTLPDTPTADAFFLEPDARDAHARKFDAYRKSLAPLLGELRKLGLGVGKDAVEMIDWHDARIAVASFNSSWFAHDDGDMGKLWLGEANIAEAGDRLAEEKATFRIALMHHPQEYLDEQERDTIEDRMERTFDLVLRGHLHKNKTKVVKSQRGGYIEVAGKAAYQSSLWPNGCYLGEIRPCARTVKLYPYQYGKGADPWVLDTTVFPDDVADGYAHTFEVPEKRILSGTIRRAREQAAMEVVQSMSPNMKRQMAEELGWHHSLARNLSPDVEQRIARKAAVANDDSALWAKPEQAKKLEKAVGKAVVEEAFANADDAPRFVVVDSASLGKALMAAATKTRTLLMTSPLPLNDHERRVVFLEMVQRLIQPGWAKLVVRRGASSTVDLNMGVSDDSAIRKVVIKVAPASFSTFAPSLAQLEADLAEQHAMLGALVLAGDFGTEVKEPRIENVKTPNGRDVILMHLPLPSSPQ